MIEEDVTPVYCENCAKEIVDPEDLVVLITPFFGGIRVYCVSCFGSWAKRKYDTAYHIILTDFGLGRILSHTVFYGGAPVLLGWFFHISLRPDVDVQPSRELLRLILVILMSLLASSYVKIMVQRWYSWRHFELPTLRRTGRRQ